MTVTKHREDGSDCTWEWFKDDLEELRILYRCESYDTCKVIGYRILEESDNVFVIDDPEDPTLQQKQCNAPRFIAWGSCDSQAMPVGERMKYTKCINENKFNHIEDDLTDCTNIEENWCCRCSNDNDYDMMCSNCMTNYSSDVADSRSDY